MEARKERIIEKSKMMPYEIFSFWFWWQVAEWLRFLWDGLFSLGRNPARSGWYRKNSASKKSIRKKLVEELTPISRFIQAYYNQGRQLKVKWKNGSQPNDLEVFSSGWLVEQGYCPAHHYVEVTTAMHKNNHILRQLLHENGGGFTVKGVKRDSKKNTYQNHMVMLMMNMSSILQTKLLQE